MQMKAYVGYDLGEDRTITDFAVIDDTSPDWPAHIYFAEMTMPDQNVPGKPMPTGYAFDEDGKVMFASTMAELPEDASGAHVDFRRWPADLLPQDIDGRRKGEILDALEREGFTAASNMFRELGSPRLRDFAKAICTFTNAIFEDETYKEQLQAAIAGCDGVVFCVGYPAKWETDGLSVAIYKAILSESALGQGTYAGIPSSIVMAAESSAVLLFIKNMLNSIETPYGYATVLIDVGPSATDVTVTVDDCRMHLYHGGREHLGEHTLNYLVREWYLEQVAQDKSRWETYQYLVSRDRTYDIYVTLACRLAIEDVLTSVSHKRHLRIMPLDIRATLTPDVIGDLMENRPVGPVLKRHADIDDGIVAPMGTKSWNQLFEELIRQTHEDICVRRKLSVHRVILTGSASKMPSVKSTVSRVFGGDGSEILMDMDPSHSVSKGLVLAGITSERSKSFRQDILRLVEIELPDLINESIPQLVNSLSRTVEPIIIELTKEHFCRWREGGYETLDDMSAGIVAACNEHELANLLAQSKEYNDAVLDWANNVAGRPVLARLKEVCENNGVANITQEDLIDTAIRTTTINDGIPTNVAKYKNTVADVIGTIVNMITVIVLHAIIKFTLYIITAITLELAWAIILILAAIPVAGPSYLIVLVGITVFHMIKNGTDRAKNKVVAKIRGANIPIKLRSAVSDKRVAKVLDEADVAGMIREALLSDATRRELVNSVSTHAGRWIKEKADEIALIIESM